MVDAITSRNGRLVAGMTRADLQAQMSNSADRAAKKLAKAFEMADGLGYDGVKDGVISEKEIEAYDKEMKKKNWRTGLAIAGGVAVTVLTALAVRKGIKLNKELEATKTALTDTQAVLTDTQSALTTTEGVLADTEKALGEAREAMGYGSGTIQAGDDVAKFAARTKGGKATFTLAEGNEVFPDVWNPNGANYTPKRGDIIMGYGDAELSWGIQNPNVVREMEAKGLTAFPDRAVSAEPELMYKTYIGQDGTAAAGRDFTKQPLVFGETVPAQKKIFPSEVSFADEGTSVVTLEAAKGSGEAARVGVGQFVQWDIEGNPYVKDVQDMIKRLDPKGEVSEGMFAKIKEFINYRKSISSNALLSDSTKASAIARRWEMVKAEIAAMM